MNQKILVGALSLLMSLSAFALDLTQAKSQGLIGEQVNGYIGLIKESTEAKALLDDINTKRKEAYISLAKKNNLSLQDIEALAGKKLIKKAGSGEFVQSVSGSWVKK
jgi:uncharacterized protein YdbL (DUF1318 family)